MTAPAATNASVHNLGPIERIPLGEGRTFAVDGAQVAVFRGRDGSLFATQSQCPHREGPLADGLVGAGVVICPLHAYKFQLATGAPIGHDCGELRTYPAWQDGDGAIWLEVAPPP